MYHPDADGNSVRRAPATRRAPPHTTTATAHSLFPSDADAGSRPQDSDASVSLCRAWITSGHCPKMSTCKFRHGTCGVAIGKARAEWIAQRRQRQVRVKSGRCSQVRTLTASPLRRANIPTTADDDVPPEEKQSYRARAAVLAQWMSETFREEDLAQGVLDVAGGRGDLSFELTVSHSLRCTVVDPRPVRLTKHQHRRLTQALTALERTRPSDAYVAKVVAAAQHRSLVLAQAKALRSQGDSEGAVALLRRFESEDVAGVGVCVGNLTRTASASEEDEDEWWGGGEWPGDLFFQDDPVDDCNNVEEVQVPREKGAKSLAETLRLCRSSPDTCQCGSFLMAQEQVYNRIWLVPTETHTRRCTHHVQDLSDIMQNETLCVDVDARTTFSFNFLHP